MTQEFSQEFVFDADAKQIRDYMMGGAEQNVRKIEMTNGVFFFQGYLSLDPAPKALYGGGIMVYICDGDRLDKTRLLDKIYWLVSENEVVDISITQSKQGTCKVSLYIENDPKNWCVPGGNPHLAMNVGMQFISDWWNEIIQGWLEKQGDQERSEPTMKANDLAVNKTAGLGKALNTRRKVIIGLLLILPIAVVLFVLTLLVVLGILPWHIAVILSAIGLAIAGATAWVGAMNNVLALVEKLVNKR